MNKKLPSRVLLALVAGLCGASLLAQQAEPKQAPQKKQAAAPLPGAGTGGTTPHATTSTVIGANRNDGCRVTVTYGRPHAVHPRKGGEARKIWGGLVPWDKADRLGADEATVLITQRPLAIAGSTLPAGAYTLYIVPSENGTSKLAFSKKLGDWGIPVDENQDVLRADLKKEPLDSNVEQLTIVIENTPPRSKEGVLKIKWENTQFSLPFQVQS